MPIYEYECEECGFHMEGIFSIKEKPENIACTKCLGNAKSIISASADRKEWNPYIDENLGPEPVVVQNRAHRRKLMKKAGLVEYTKTKPGMPGQWI